MARSIDSDQTTRDDVLLVNGLFLTHPSHEGYPAIDPGSSPRPPAPLVSAPLGACHVLRHSDGSYYMTGTAGGSRVRSNDGIYLWRSDDLHVWEYLGKIFDIERDGSWCREFAVRFRIETSTGDQEVFLRDEPGCDHRAIVSPRLFEIDGRTWLTFGMNYGGTGILRSDTGSPTGPYVEHARITDDGHCASLIEEGDGSVSYLTDEGSIARLTSDLRATDEPFTQLQLSDEYRCHTSVQRAVTTGRVGPRGASILRHDGWYYWFAADFLHRCGYPHDDTFVAVSRDLRGPYSRRYLAIPQGGEATVFCDGDGGLHAAISRDDWFSVVRLHAGTHGYLRPETGVLMDPDPVASIRPMRWEEGSGSWIRDPQMLAAPDGQYYLTGTTSVSAEHRGIELWSSDSLDDFVFEGIVWEPDVGLGYWYNARRHGRLGAFWAPELHWLRGSYYITFSLQYGGTGMLRSVSGLPTGPYEEVGQITGDRIDSSLFEDLDGTVYYVWQDGRVARMADDMTALAEEHVLLTDADGERVGYEGVSLVSMAGRYVLCAAAWNGDVRVDGTYDLMSAVADSLTGPYSRRHVSVPHGGHGTPFRAHDGQWYSTVFGNDRTAPFRKRPGIVAVRLSGDRLECQAPSGA